MTQPDPVGILGGTGPLGRGLARRLGAAGVPVILGSRDPARASAAAEPLPQVTGDSNEGAAAARTVIVAVPHAGHAELLTALAPTLAGALVIDCVNPLGFDKRGPFAQPPPAGSAAEEAAAILTDATVIAAFHHLSAELLDSDVPLDTDTLVLGDDRAAVARGIELATLIGINAIFGGRLRNAGQVEAFTANLIAMNRRYGTAERKAHAGIRITGLA